LGLAKRVGSGRGAETGRDLSADEFQCGDLPFFYEFLTPFGHCPGRARSSSGAK
jgi:hypothetical protein